MEGGVEPGPDSAGISKPAVVVVVADQQRANPLLVDTLFRYPSADDEFLTEDHLDLQPVRRAATRHVDAVEPLGYDPFNDFATITLTAKNTSLLTVRASDGPHTVKELIARGKAGHLTYGAGILITRLAGYQFGQFAGIDLQLIPYKGSSDVVQGLLTGSVDFIIDGAAPSLPLIKSGQFRGLCAQFCGLDHDLMTFTVRVVPPAAYRAWIAERGRTAS